MRIGVCPDEALPPPKKYRIPKQFLSSDPQGCVRSVAAYETHCPQAPPAFVGAKNFSTGDVENPVESVDNYLKALVSLTKGVWITLWITWAVIHRKKKNCG